MQLPFPDVLLSQVTSLQELKALETQINEFGQTPKQLFTHPHPPRMVQPPAPDPATVFSHTSSSSSSKVAGDRPAVVAGAASTAAAAAAAVAAGGASKARLRGGGEDAAGGALCFALLSTILAAAAPEIQASAAAGEAAAAGQSGAASAALAVPKVPAGGVAGSGGLQRSGSNSSGLSLSPVSSNDLLSAAPCKMPSPLQKAAAQPQQQDQQAGGSLRSMLGRLTDTATAAAGSAAARVASAMQSSGSASTSNGSTGTKASGMGLGGMPVTSSKSGIKLSLSWMQQQFEEGLALSSKASGSSNSSSTGPAAAGASSVTQSGDSITNSSPPKAAAAAAGVLHSNPSRTAAASRIGAAGISPVQWPCSLPKQLLVKKSLRLQQEPLTAVAALPDGHVVVAGHGGLLRVLEAPQLSTIRSVKLSEEDLLCLSLIPAAQSAVRPASSSAAAAAAIGGGAATGSSSSTTRAASSASNAAAGDVQLPLVLAGSQTGRVFAYAAIAGQPLGSFVPHNDAVSSMLQLGHAGSRLATASWDCTVKVSQRTCHSQHSTHAV
jgi:hypothetical protein